MAYEWIDEYVLAKPGVTKDYKAEWDMIRYMIGSKMFCDLGGDKEKRPIFTIKLDPVFGQYLRDTYDTVVPGYYSNKLHWSSLYIQAPSVPDNVVRDMIDQAYSIVLNSLPRKAREQLEV